MPLYLRHVECLVSASRRGLLEDTSETTVPETEQVADLRISASISAPAVTLAMSDGPSIRAIAGAAHAMACARCGAGTLIAGPTGFDEHLPVCDQCMLDIEPQLGMVLGLVAVSRSFAAIETDDEATRRHVAAALLSFARLYERFAANHGPARASAVLERWLRNSEPS